MDLFSEKKELRKEIINERLNLSQEEVLSKSLAITEKLVAMEEFTKARSIMLYSDFRNEVKTEFIINEALKHGKGVFLPVTDVTEKRLIPTEIKEYPSGLVRDSYGVLVPSSGKEAAPEELDLIIIPGVGFDEEGNRLGYGGGFYDRFLPKTRTDIKLIAIAFEIQIKKDVYAERHDQPVHLVITEERVITNK